MLLVEQVKRKLNITWDDASTEMRLSDIIEAAKPIMRHKLGIWDTKFDFSASGMENSLFLAYCLYAWNHAENEFSDNYASDIMQVRQKNEVLYYGKVSDDAEG